jgi:hypothetical protein
MGEMDLDDVVLSWSLPDITDHDLYRDKVRHRSVPLLSPPPPLALPGDDASCASRRRDPHFFRICAHARYGLLRCVIG